MKYQPLKKPTGPGFYWLAENGEPLHLVELCVESDSHRMFYVLLPGEDYRYHVDLWAGALWFGPLDASDLILASMEQQRGVGTA